MSFNRSDRQANILQWVIRTFGEQNATLHERALRLMEETVELMQATGIDRGRLVNVINHVYGKPPGEPRQEVGGIGVCLLAYCEAAGIDAELEEERECNRVLSIPVDYFRKRHNAKADAGIAARAPKPEEP